VNGCADATTVGTIGRNAAADRGVAWAIAKCVAEVAGMAHAIAPGSANAKNAKKTETPKTETPKTETPKTSGKGCRHKKTTRVVFSLYVVAVEHRQRRPTWCKRYVKTENACATGAAVADCVGRNADQERKQNHRNTPEHKSMHGSGLSWRRVSTGLGVQKIPKPSNTSGPPRWTT